MPGIIVKANLWDWVSQIPQIIQKIVEVGFRRPPERDNTILHLIRQWLEAKTVES